MSRSTIVKSPIIIAPAIRYQSVFIALCLTKCRFVISDNHLVNGFVLIYSRDNNQSLLHSFKAWCVDDVMLSC